MRWEGSEKGRLLWITVAGLAAMILIEGCRAGTVVQVGADVASFLSQDKRAGTLTFAASSGVTAYLLPGLQVDDNGVAAGSQMQGGSLFQLPVPSYVTAGLNTIEVSLAMDLANSGTTGPTPDTLISVYAAGGKTTDIYTQGTPVLFVDVGPLAAGASRTISDSVVLTKGDPGFDAFVDPSGVRVGMRIDQAPSTTGTTILKYDLTMLSVLVKALAGALVP